MDQILLQKQIRDNAQDVQNYLLDLKNWQEEMKRKEETLRDSSDNKHTAPVQCKVQKSSKTSQIKTGDGRKHEDKTKKVASSDYSAWERFDADEACKLLDREKNYDVSENKEEKPLEYDEDRVRDQANYEKEMGNKFVKKLKWNEALQCYTQAIQLYPSDAVFYANRALCHLKLCNFVAAKADSSRSLELDPNYVKAYQRRAAAGMELQFFQEAKQDLLNVLKLEPNNSFSKAQLLKLEQNLANTERAAEGSGQPAQDESINTADNISSHKYKVGTECHSRQQVESQNIVHPIFKPPHLRSKKPLKRIPIREIQDSVVDGEEKILETIIRDNTTVNGSPEVKGMITHNTPEEHSHIEGNVGNILRGGFDVQIPSVPTSSVQFKTAWNTLKNNPEKRFQYLKQIPGHKLPNIFRDSMESSILSEIIGTLVTDFLRHKVMVYPYLKGLSLVGRFGALTMFLSKEDKSGLEKLLNSCEENGECTSEAAVHLRKIYEL